MMQRCGWLTYGVFFLGLAAQGAHAETLVQRDGDHYKPGLAKSWRVDGTAVLFDLQDGADAAKIVQALNDQLGSAAKVSLTVATVRIEGMALPALLDQLANLSVTADDPLAMMGGLGGAVATAATEGGGSIRAARPTDMPAGLLNDPENPALTPNPNEIFVAEVIAVRRGEFPRVSLTLKVHKAANAATGWLKSLRPGRVLDAAVHFTGKADVLDLQQSINRQNLGAFYLMVGDHITLHATPGASEQFSIDWLERRAL